MNGKVIVSAVTFSISVLSSCMVNDPVQDLRAYVQEQKSRPTGVVPPPPEFKAPEFVSYTASMERSPFEPFRAVKVEVESNNVPQSNVKPDFARAKEFLESFRVEDLLMVGTITGYENDNSLWALIRDGQGEVHRVKAGNYLGRNFGKIIEISATQIELIEIVPAGDNNWVERPRTIILEGLEQ